MKKYLLYPSVYGIMAVCDNKKIMANVKNNGKIEVKSENFSKKRKFSNRFMIRGLLFLFFGVYYTFYGIFNFNDIKNSKIAGVDKASKSLNISHNTIIFFTMSIIVLFLSIFLLGIVPLKISFYLAPKNFNVLIKRIIVSFSKIVIIFGIFLALKPIDAFKNYYKFNAMCVNVQKSKHQINFLYYFICSVMLDIFVLAFVGVVANSWYFIFINILVSLVVFSVNYEILIQIQGIKWLNLLIYPFCWLFYEKPSQLEQKCVNIVLNELDISNSKRDKMQEDKMQNEISFSQAYVEARQVLENANRFEKSDLDFIFADVLGKSRAEIRLVKSISKEDYKKINKIVSRRASGEPISKILGYTDFYGLKFVVTQDVLSPRMDTERLVECVLKDIKPKQTVLDIGTGSGAIAITIAKNSTAKVTAVDISENALKVASQNAKNNQVKVNFIKSNLFDNLGRFSKFDIIVSNPPYIPTKDVDGLDDEVKKFDPLLALDGGVSGLDFYERIIEQSPKKLNKNGKIYFEVGIKQAQNVKKLLQKNFKDIRIVKDYNKIDRVVCATLK